MPASDDRQREYARGMAWVSRSTAVVGEMILPGILGAYLDRQFGTMWMTPVGLVLGVIGGISHLVWMGQQEQKKAPRQRPPDSGVGHE